MDSKKFRKITLGLFFVYLFFLIWIVLFKTATRIEEIPSIDWVNLIPYSENAYLNNKIDTREMLFNVLLFIPFGLYMALLYKKGSLLKQWIIVILTSLSFELIQLTFSIGVCDITDLIHNSLGGLIGIILYRLSQKVFREKTDRVLQIILLCGTILVVIGTLAILFLTSS